MKRIGVLSILLAGLLTGSASAQFTSASQLPIGVPFIYSFSGPGARAMGMGNAFLAVSDDINAIGWNPSGLRLIDKPVMALSFRNLNPRGTIQAISLSDKQNSSLSGLSQASLAFPFKIMKRHVGVDISYDRAFDEELTAATSVSFLQDNNPLDEDNVPSDFYEAKLDALFRNEVDALRFGFGTKLSSKSSFGLALNVIGGSGLNRYDFQYRIDNFKDFDGDLGPGEQVYDVQVINQIIDSVTYSGFNLTAGYAYDLSRRVSLALVVRTPYSLKLKRDYKVIPEFYKQGQPTGIESFGSFFDDIVTKVEIPVSVALGVAFKPTANLTLAGDAEFMPYKSSDILQLDSTSLSASGERTESFTKIPIELVDKFSLRAGGELVIATGSKLLPILPLRAGVHYEQQPTQSYGSDLTTLSKESASGFSLGAGVRWAQVHFDIAYSYTSFNQGYPVAISLVNGVTLEDFTNAPILIDYNKFEGRDHRLSFAFTGVF